MRETERSDTGAADDSERSGEDQSRSQDTTTAPPEPGAAPPPPGDDPPRAADSPEAGPPPDEATLPEDEPVPGEAPAAVEGSPPGPAAPGESGKPKRFKSLKKPGKLAKPKLSRRLLALAGLVVVGLAALGGGVFGLVWAFTRTPNSAQVTAAANAESARQWRWLAAGDLFPALVVYQTTVDDAPTHATLVGIAPAASCAKAADKATAKALTAAGCVTVLRATYTDASHTVLDTVGVAVMKSTAAANKADSALGSGTSSGLLPVSFPSTVSSAFTAQGRLFMDMQATGRYVVFDAAGYADGRKGSSDSCDRGGTGVSDLAGALGGDLTNRFTPSSNPCGDREVRCSY